MSANLCLQLLTVVGCLLPAALSSDSMAALSSDSMADTCEGDLTPLAQARAIGRDKPAVSKKKGGEFEGHLFWDRHEALFHKAWSSYPPLHPELYRYDEAWRRRFIPANLQAAVDVAAVDEGPLRSLLGESPAVAGVHTTQEPFGLFTSEFCSMLLEELEHRSAAGIPLRRPNGMNRFGCILDDIGFKAVFDGVVRDYVRPLAEMLYPQHIAAGDASQHYAFTVEYGQRPGGGGTERQAEQEAADFDVDLHEHRDASVATLNVCLGEGNFTGGTLRFRADDVNARGEPGWGGSGQDNSIGGGEIFMMPGLALMHKGQHRHAALPLLTGHRVNLIVWLFGDGGVVRMAPYPEKEQLSALQRWGGDRTASIG